MSKKPKLAPTGVIQRLSALRDGISGLFKVIRTARVVLRHLEACLQELWRVSELDIDTEPAPALAPPVMPLDPPSPVADSN